MFSQHSVLYRCIPSAFFRSRLAAIQPWLFTDLRFLYTLHARMDCDVFRFGATTGMPVGAHSDGTRASAMPTRATHTDPYVACGTRSVTIGFARRFKYGIDGDCWIFNPAAADPLRAAFY